MEITNDAILERLVSSATGKQAAAEILREQTAARIKLAADIEKLRRERGEKCAPLNADTTAKRAKLDAARTALAAVEKEYTAAAQHEAATIRSYDARIAATERKLIATAPQAITDFIVEMDDATSETTATEILKRRRPTDKINTHSDRIINEVWTNAESLRERLDAIRAARAEAEKLKTRILSDDVLAERLQELRDGLPAVQMRYSHEA